MGALLSVLDLVWSGILKFLRVASPCRFSALVLLLGSAFLFVEQGREALITLAQPSDKDAADAQTAFLLAVSLWALTLWYSGRVLLMLRHAAGEGVVEERMARRIATAVPRAIGVAAFAFAAAAVYLAAEEVKTTHAGGVREELMDTARWCLRLAAVFLALAWLRRRLPGFRETPHSRAGLGDLPRITVAWMVLLFAIALGLYLVVFFDAQTGFIGGTLLHPAVLTLISVTALLPFGSALIFATRRHRVPVLAAVFALGAAFTFGNENHDLRLAGKAPPAPAEAERWLAARPGVDALARRWVDLGPAADRRPVEPFVIVATAGGGLRAAYWTMHVLGTIREENPAFHDRLVAISGVSGGSLGATVYLATQHPAALAACHAAGRRGVDCGREALAGDFLTPVVAALLSHDLVQRLLPVPVFSDRAASLERAWERHWSRATRTSLLARPFHELWPRAERPWPALLLNGTWTETGRRIVTSNLSLGDDFADAIDLFEILGQDVPAATAANNSARFPYVEPAGLLHFDCRRLAIAAAPAPRQADLKERCGSQISLRWGHLVDGGYFENFGAATAMEALDAFLAAAERHAASTGGRPIALFPVVIQISSDPELDSPAPEARRFAYESASPIETIFNTRAARGALAAAALERRTRVLGGAYFHFRMCDLERASPRRRNPPLGWMLDLQSFRNIEDATLYECGNAALLPALGRCLAATDAASRDDCLSRVEAAQTVQASKLGALRP
jgi:hypothetical protein